MTSSRCAAGLLALAVVLTGCAGGSDVPTDPPTPSPSAAPSPAASASPCDGDDVLAAVAASLAAARLPPVAAWSTDVSPNRFADRTASGEEYARRLGLDCGLVLAEDDSTDGERLLSAAWTGPRLAWVVQSAAAPPTPYAPDATVTVAVGETEGEWLADDRTVWAGTLPSGETFVVGHVDLNLGAAAKDWVAADRPRGDDAPPEDGLLPSEQHALAVLREAGMREADIAEPAQVGSEEGHLQFVSPTGQISVADVGPVGWFDPMVPRYLDGPTRIEVLDGEQVRVTEPGADAPAYVVGAELGFACEGFVWLLQPPGNGDAAEQLRSAAAILATDACDAG